MYSSWTYFVRCSYDIFCQTSRNYHQDLLWELSETEFMKALCGAFPTLTSFFCDAKSKTGSSLNAFSLLFLILKKCYAFLFKNFWGKEMVFAYKDTSMHRSTTETSMTVQLTKRIIQIISDKIESTGHFPCKTAPSHCTDCIVLKKRENL